jgi:hypothetical protein
MANPNLNSATSVLGDNSWVRLDTITETLLVSNAASSNELFQIDSILVSNVDGAAACDITISAYAAATNTGTATKLAHTVAVPADAVLLPILKDTAFKLKEAQSLYATASASGDLHVIVNYTRFS